MYQYSNIEKSDLAVYGHTMAVHKGSLYIFGGVKMESPTNDLLQIIPNSSSSASPLSPAPHRRRDHAMAFMNRFLVVQGGVSSRNDIKSTLFYFDTESGKWHVPLQYQMPFLSHHAFIVAPLKNRKKQCTFQEAVDSCAYIFGGKN